MGVSTPILNKYSEEKKLKCDTAYWLHSSYKVSRDMSCKRSFDQCVVACYYVLCNYVHLTIYIYVLLIVMNYCGKLISLQHFEQYYSP